MTDTTLRLESMKFAMQAALQYGAFDPRNLTNIAVLGQTPDHNICEHYPAFEQLAESIFSYLKKEEEKSVLPEGTEGNLMVFEGHK